MVRCAVQNSNGNQVMLYLYHNEGQWYWNYNYVDNDNWNANDQLLTLGHSSFKRFQPTTGHLANFYQRGCKLAGAAIIQRLYLPQQLHVDLQGINLLRHSSKMDFLVCRRKKTGHTHFFNTI